MNEQIMDKTKTNNDLEIFCVDLPKVELHAHINGSISKETMKKLIAMKVTRSEMQNDITDKMTMILDGEQKTLDECFQIFKFVHQIVTDQEAVYLATKDVIREFAADGVKYLELRSTPKSLGSMTKDMYIEAVMKAINESNNSCELDIITKFLLSIDRRNGSIIAQEAIDLALKHQAGNDCIVGIDLSGDPTFGKSADFIPALARASSFGLKTAVHLAETKEPYSETQALLNVVPDRIGHGTCLLPECGGHQNLVDFIVERKIPLELCLTSNVKGQTVKNYHVHHFKSWYEMQHPCVICTDDKGVFATTLSKEYCLAAKTFQLDFNALWDMSENAIDCIFASDNVKKDLTNKWKEKREKLFPN